MISTRGRYALRVMIDIAKNQKATGFIPLKDIADRQQISEKYLEGILVILTRENMLIGVRGKGGGYRLTKSAEEYTVAEILLPTEGTLAPIACLKEGAPACNRSDICKTLPMWRGLNSVIINYLSGIKLSDLL